MAHVARPDTVRLTLPDGEFVIIKRKLSAGERDDNLARSGHYNADGKLVLNPATVRVERLNAYLVGWSLTDGDAPGEGNALPMSPQMSDEERVATIRSLDVDTFDAIHEAIGKHEQAEAKKKTPSGSPAAASSSESPFALAGTQTG
jgi:hypothetical protein